MFRFFRFINIFVSLLVFCFIINISELRAASNTYPKKANYFLKWTIANHEVPELAKWDLLILDMEVQENSRANLKKIRQLNPDIIILDIMLPEMDGLELTKILRKDFNYSHIPILLLTARNSVEDRIACYDAGADGYISKPFDVKLLQARITNFLVHKQQSQEHFKSNVEVDVSALNVHASDKDFLDKAVGIIENHIDDSGFGIDVFAEQMNVANSSLHRKIKAMTGLPPVELIRNIRLKHAAQILKNQTVSISEVAYSVGFTDPRYFSTCFKTAFGKTPTAYQKESITK